MESITFQDEENDPKVFIPNLSNHDFSDAERYGKLIYVTKGKQGKYNINSMCRVWISTLEQSRAEDYIVLTSLGILCCVGCAVFAKKHGRLNLLLWRGGKYVARELILTDI